MSKSNKRLWIYPYVLAIIVAVITIDQLIKIWIKTHLCLHESIRVTNWFYLYFTENKGMAYGLSFINTNILAVSRLLVIIFFIYWLFKQLKKDRPVLFITFLALIIGGALGNLCDNCFYGLVFSESTSYNVASLVPWGEGYGRFFSGKVVDMLYLPIIDFYFPLSWPILKGYHFIFFSPIFNFADFCVSVAAISLLLFYRKFFLK